MHRVGSVPWGVDSHFHTRTQPRPAWDQSTFGNCDRCAAVVGEVRIHGVQDKRRGLRRASLSRSLSAPPHGAAPYVVLSHGSDSASWLLPRIRTCACAGFGGARASRLPRHVAIRASSCSSSFSYAVATSRPSKNGRRCVPVRAVVAVGRRRTVTPKHLGVVLGGRRDELRQGGRGGRGGPGPPVLPYRIRIVRCCWSRCWRRRSLLVTGPKCRGRPAQQQPRGGRRGDAQRTLQKLCRRIPPF
jgi:hypothetical protein